VPERHGATLPPTAQAQDAGLPARGAMLAPDAELRSMFLVEAERACHRACTFCVMRRGEGAGMRLVSAERLTGTPARCRRPSGPTGRKQTLVDRFGATPINSERTLLT